MTPPIRMVPVEPQIIARLQAEADHPGIADSCMVFGPDLRAVLRAYTGLTAAPVREEGGAVEAPEPPAHLSAEAAYGWSCGYEAALATREEAPAEAGDRETLRVLLDNLVIAQSLSKELRERATDEARSYLYALRAQPQALEEAQPVHALEIVPDPTVEGAKRFVGVTTPPAPEAEKLRAAVEALEPFALLAPGEGKSPVNMSDPLSKWLTIAQLVDAAEALAALQQEGRK